MNQKFILIAFKFPPYAGVGGFRWSKLSKYLAQQGHQIHVITVNWDEHGPNTYIDDVQHPNISIHRIASGYPHNFRYRVFKNRYLNAFKNRILLYPLNRYIFYDDEAQYWGRYLIPYVEQLLKQENINLLVTTGSPFQANRWAAVIKQRNPHIRLIQDFRDDWVDDPLRSWPKNKIDTVRQWQNFAVETADCIVTVTYGLLDLYLRETNQICRQVIRNGYDDDSMNGMNIHKPTHGIKDNRFNFVHAGSVSGGRQEPMQKFLFAIRDVRTQIPEIKVTLIGEVNRMLAVEFNDLIKTGFLELKGYVSPLALFELLQDYRYALQLNARVYPFSLSTKIYEYGMLKIPTISLNYGGEIESLIKEYDLGYSLNIDKENIVRFLINLYREPTQSFDFKIEEFSYANLAKRYSDLLNTVGQ